MATSRTRMSLRPFRAKEDGYYRRILAGNDIVHVYGDYLREDALEDGVFEVEKLIEECTGF